MNYMKIHHLILILFLYWPQRVYLYYYPTIYWSPNNCRFNLNKPGQPQKFFFKVKPSSHLFFACPHVAIWQDMASASPHLQRMFENIMMVDEEGYKTCTVNKTRNPKLNKEMLRCDESPMTLKYIEEILSPDRAFIHEVKYTLGQNYYFISTSDGTKNSLDNLAGGHCTSHHMKLQVYLCKKDEPCEFEMPKCPYTDVFHNSHKRTTTPAATTTNRQTTLNLTSSRVPTVTSQGPRTTQQKKQRIFTVKETKLSKKPTTEISHSNVGALGQGTETLWGKDRKHIIIHITMALVILILLLCLIYIWISRRKPFLDSKKSKGIDSELYRQRPMSIQQQPSENEPFSTRQNGVATHCV